MFYRLLARPFLYLMQAETAHHLIVGLLSFVQSVPGVAGLVRLFFPTPANTSIDAFGLTFPTPVGLAAGFDKDAKVYRALGATGFGAVEVGTLTGEAQPGNPTPRLFRLVEDRALLNRMGFNNHGSEAAAQRLGADPWLRKSIGRRTRPVIGINIGKTKVVPAESAAADYEKSAHLLGPLADYLVVNVSSPNTPGLRDLQAVESLRPILATVRSALDAAVTERRVPLLVKIAPDLSDEDVIAVADLALELKLDGIIATNTTISRENLQTPAQQVEALGAGGLSGAPIKRRSLHVLRLLRSRVGDKLVLVAAGGIENAEDAWSRITSGATLIQIYSGMIYEGPSLPASIARGLSRKMREAGFSSMAQAVGSDAPPMKA